MYNSPADFGQDRSAWKRNCILYNLLFITIAPTRRNDRVDRSARTDSPSFSAPADESAGERQGLFSDRSARDNAIVRFLGWNAGLGRPIRFVEIGGARRSNVGRTRPINRSRPNRRTASCGLRIEKREPSFAESRDHEG
jgi:hypothetical protein